uniref:Acyl-CoA synthetase (AMP-forming)/AMP-acid ligase II n=1 Tax=Candidatus Kentrum sp. FW TaxID=2126338 RepID=A0A450TJS8_9GAMM|nr:MAG: Acyl-CoA synthetase (AMP-forming)/AMP-acid ligase II [Candidatus Kentron sp. FW]
MRTYVSKDSHQATTLVELLRHRAKTQSDKTAYTFLEDGEIEEASLTCGRLDEQARAIAVRLQSITAPGERALLLYHAGLDFICAFFGCLYAGVIAVPTYPPRRNRTDARFAAIAKDAQASVVLTTGEILAGLDIRQVKTPEFENIHWLATDDSDTEMASGWQMPDIAGETLAFLQYTSGSTGAPKGVMVSHGNLMHNLAYMKRGGELGEVDTGVFWLPAYHDMGLISGIINPVYTGMHNILMAPVAFLQRPFRWLRAMSRYQATYSGGPNFAYDLCVDKVRPEDCKDLDLSHWRCAFSGAEPIRKETLDRFTDRFGPYGFRRGYFYPCYGLAEVTLAATGAFVADEPIVFEANEAHLGKHRVRQSSQGDSGVKFLIGSGHAWPGMEVMIVDPETSVLCPLDGIGEIWIRGESVAQGYWGQSEETRETFRTHLADTGEGPFLRTGDLGFLKDGELFVTGRLKDLIIIRGQNYYPQDIEITVERAVGFIKPNGCAATSITVERQERLVIAMEASRELTRKIKAVRKQQGPSPNEHSEQSAKAREELDRTMANLAHRVREAVAREHEISLYALAFVKPGEFPRTTSGKVRRRACRALFLEEKDKPLFFWHEHDETGGVGRMGKGAQRRAHHPSSGPMNPMGSVGSESVDSKMGTAPGGAFAHPTQDAITAWLIAKTAKLAGISPKKIDTGRSFAYYGLNSLAMVGLSGELSKWLDKPVATTLAYDYPTIDAMARHITDKILTLEFTHGKQDGTQLPDLIPIPRQDNIPLSFAEHRYWLYQTSNPDGRLFNIPLWLRFTGKLDVGVLEQGLNGIIRRHEILRTTFPVVDGSPVQSISPVSHVNLTVKDLQELSEEKQSNEVKRLTDEEIQHRPFDLARGPLFRVTLMRLEEESHILLICAHHIILDAWSLEILLRELASLYTAGLSGNPPPLLPLPIQYADYAVWQHRVLTPEVRETKLDYWRQWLARGEPPPLELPTDRQRLATVGPADTVHYRLPSELVGELKVLSQRAGSTMFATVVTALAVVLYRYSGCRDIVIGSPFANRGRPELEQMIGIIGTTLLLRFNIGDNPRFSDVLHQGRQTVQDAMANQDLPFEEMTKILQPEHQYSSPLFRVLISFLPMVLTEELVLPDVTMKSIPLDLVETRRDLYLIMWEKKTPSESFLQGWWRYRKDLFDEETVRKIMESFQAILKTIVTEPEKLVDEFFVFPIHQDNATQTRIDEYYKNVTTEEER